MLSRFFKAVDNTFILLGCCFSANPQSMDAEVYIKDSSFLPDIIEVKPGTRVCFLNEDAVRHEIHCKNHTSLFPQNIDAEKKCYYHFPKLGRYEITSPGSEMKVRRISILYLHRGDSVTITLIVLMLESYFIFYRSY